MSKRLRSVGHFDQLKIENFAPLSARDIERLSQILTFDLEACESRLRGGDAWQQILLAHLFIDHVLTATIEEAASRPTALNLDRSGFATKLAMAEGFRLIDPEFLPFARRLNSIRNSIAHDLNFKITHSHKKELENLSPKMVRDSADDWVEREGGTRLFWVLFYSLIDLELYRQQRVEGRLRVKAGAARAGEVARSLNGRAK